MAPSKLVKLITLVMLLCVLPFESTFACPCDQKANQTDQDQNDLANTDPDADTTTEPDQY